MAYTPDAEGGEYMVPQEMPKLLTVKDVIALTGYSSATVYRYIDSGLLPVVKIMKALRIKQDDLQRLIDGSTEYRGVQKRDYKSRQLFDKNAAKWAGRRFTI